MRAQTLIAISSLAVALTGCSDSAPGGEGLFGKVRSALGMAPAPEAEPNDAFANATPLGGDDVVFRANQHPLNDVDYYSFTAQAGDRVFAALVTGFSSSASSATPLELLAPDGGTLIESDVSNGGPGAYSAPSLAGVPITASGTWYLRVRPFTASSELRPYDLHFKLQHGSPIPEVEPNGVATPQPLPASGWVSGSLSSSSDVDVYSLTAAPGETLFFSLDMDPERDGVDVAPHLEFGPLGTATISEGHGATSGPDSTALAITLKDAGTYQVKVLPYTSTALGTYQLSVSRHAPSPATASCTTYTSSDVPKAIGAGAVVTSSITIPGNARIADLDLGLQLTHASAGSLDLHLQSPAGNDVALITNIGSSATWNFILDEEAAYPVNAFNAVDGVIVQPEPAFRLGWFDNEKAAGTWTLVVENESTTATGQLNGWSLTVCDATTPPLSCPGATVPVAALSTHFETGAGFTSSGSGNEWELGTPVAVPIVGCNSGVSCWKTDLNGDYNLSSTQDLVSPPIDLTAGPVGGPVRVTWAMRYQMGNASADHAWVQISDVSSGVSRKLWEHLGGAMDVLVGASSTELEESAGWAVWTADASDFAGKTVKLTFHVDSNNDAFNYGGLAIDDVTVTRCGASGVCGDGVVQGSEQCDDGASNGQTGSCCSATCQFQPTTVQCRAAVAGSCDVADFCDGAGSCSADGKAANGAACDDGDACTASDSCQAGVCTGGSAVTCTASDQCHAAGTCNPATGLCSNPNKANGSACSDGNACTQTDSCQAGVCTAGAAVTCAASDQCHAAGTCNPATGVCSNPTRPNGSACNDGNSCTQSDSCQAGVCSGSNPVTCAASDQCHSAGTCNPSTGSCTNPVKANGTACNDGNLCTQSDSCEAGACTGTNPVSCGPATDQCHQAGVCNPSTGACTNPVKANGAACDDGNACTTVDACQSGSCTGSSPKSCVPSDSCHSAGTCNPSTGACTNPVKADGSACTDGNGCTQTDVCQAGVCSGSNPVTCTASDSCHAAGVCVPSTGACTNPAAPDGTVCSDGDLCTKSDACQAGSCLGSNPVDCAASDQCHVAGLCDPSTGACSNPAAPDGTSCEDGSRCTQTDFCQSGACVGSNPVLCLATDQCHVAGVCDAATGSCSNPAAPNGTGCTDGNACTEADSCEGGACVGSTVSCDDANACTADRCEPATGCHNEGSCDAGPELGKATATGCGCATNGGTTEQWPVTLLLGAGLIGLRRSRRRIVS